MTAPMSGRRAQAARNDERILAAAREVFVADPGAPIAAVAERAGVGISALYRRYRSKDELLQKLCGDGLRTYIEAAEAAVTAGRKASPAGRKASPAGTASPGGTASAGGTASGKDGGDGGAWRAFAEFMARVMDADVHSLTARLAGTFPPTEELYRLAGRANELNHRLIDRTRAAGVIRPDIQVGDLGLIFEQLASVRVGDEKRTSQLRHRYLTLYLDALRRRRRTDGHREELPGPPPVPEELAQRWAV